ncbi:bifunctional [glutamate--ammonia ligase]-adenylyl-L-tyrosine phosphorylase/[glutamate--ammonia-ligase] adenylyltransferase [Azonexus sp.]|uniref:bifunctional [glutamate--ammonia ligase]-adenylyl-L-tyrosine phosphorylase/[glutamate--ammonia-ligase] adenylyltransferase n=1 Tax=Azonexus sp. TaxID=1872668 RepID=UPI0039E636B0
MTSSFDPRWHNALTHSRYLKQLLVARPALVEALTAQWEKPLDYASLEAPFYAENTPGEHSDDHLRTALRHLRQRVMAQLILRDLGGLASLDEVMHSMSWLADFTTNTALAHHHRQLVALYGEPLSETGQALRLLVVGMGKLGGRELNVSSDVDYIFIYPEDGDTAGPKKIENFDFFTRLGKKLIQTLGDITADGQVFRVDMRLRPNGDSGPLVCSLDALENYFVTQGRAWERYAWIKSRVMNAGDNTQNEWTRALERTAHPFVFRKYLDFGTINAMRDLHAQIRREVARKDHIDHIKLGPGGIREIEFIAQVFQLIRGGRDPALQIRPTLQVLALLAERQIITPEAQSELQAAYIFLRRLEHRLQYVDDAQTHLLPTADKARELIAQSMDFADWAQFSPVLTAHRARVSQHFEHVFADPEEGEHPFTGLWLGQIDTESAHALLNAQHFRTPAKVVQRLAELRQSGRYQQLPASNQQRFDTIGPRLIEAAGSTTDPDTTLHRALLFIEHIARRGTYLALLQQYPLALRRLTDLLGASQWASDYLMRYPLLLDELLNPRLYEAATDWPAFRAQLQKTLADHADDTEREMDILREMHHAQLFRLLAQDLAGQHSIEKLSDHLSELADTVIQETLPLAWGKIRQRHCAAPKIAVIGYGKLGGKELGYASDLDLVYLYDDADPDAADNYARLVQRMNTWLSGQTGAGTLFETDLRLRPNGDAGLLAVSLDAFRDYQLKHAWTWEHQALTRARACAGDRALGERFEKLRCDILCQARDRTQLKEDILAMREKMHAAHTRNDPQFFDLKHDRGGLIDAEFIVQYLILGHAHRHPRLTANLGNIALLGIAAELGLIPNATAQAAADAYRELRRQQHLIRLSETPKAPVERSQVKTASAAISLLWNSLFTPH